MQYSLELSFFSHFKNTKLITIIIYTKRWIVALFKSIYFEGDVVCVTLSDFTAKKLPKFL